MVDTLLLLFIKRFLFKRGFRGFAFLQVLKRPEGVPSGESIRDLQRQGGLTTAADFPS